MKKVHVCVLLSVSLLAVAGAACKSGSRGPTEPTPNNIVIYSAIGASDGLGVGSSVVCTPLVPCSNGTSYVSLLERRFRGEGREVTLINLSFPGAVLSPTIQALARQIGRDVLSNFMDQQAPFISSGSTHVTVFAGGNDTNTIAQAVRAGAAGNDIRGFVDRQVQQFGADYEEMLRRMRTRAPNARIVLLNLPNLGAFPYVAGNTLQERSIVQRIAVGITDRTNALASQNVLVVDLMCDARIYDPANVSSDGFHPNDRGYALMAELAYPAVANGTARTPSSSCPQRTLLPVF